MGACDRLPAVMRSPARLAGLLVGVPRRQVFATERVLHPTSAGFVHGWEKVVEFGLDGLANSTDHGGLTASEDPGGQVKLEPVVPPSSADINELLATVANETNQRPVTLPLLKVVPK